MKKKDSLLFWQEKYEKILAKAKAAQERRKLRKKAKKPAKTPIKTLKDTLWKLTSQYVRSQSNRCFTCDDVIPDFTKRSAGHFWSKGGHGATRFDLDNLRVQCVSCNNFKGGNLSEYAVRLRRDIGDERFDALDQKAHTTKTSWKRDELEQLIEERKSLLNFFDLT